jgi:hypothetical protein
VQVTYTGASNKISIEPSGNEKSPVTILRVTCMHKKYLHKALQLLKTQWAKKPKNPV